MNSGRRVLLELRTCGIGWERPLVPPVSLTVSAGEYLLIAGPNGAGKTTLVKTMLGMIPALSGEVRYPAGRPRVGYVPQRGVVPEHYPVTARDTVLLGRALLRLMALRWSDEDRAAADRALADLDLAALADRSFGELSGGQKQRVLVARALAMEPQVLVLDEPTVNMDAVSARRLLKQLDELRRTRGMAVLIVTHDIAPVIAYADRVALLDRDRGLFRIGPTAEIAAELTAGGDA